MITYLLQEIGKDLEFSTSNYEKILLMGDFNSKMSELQWINSAVYTTSNIFLQCLQLRYVFPNLALWIL